MGVRRPLSLPNVKGLQHERGTDITCEAVRLCRRRFGTIFAAEIRRGRSRARPQLRRRQWHLDEALVRIDGAMVEPALIRCAVIPFNQECPSLHASFAGACHCRADRMAPALHSLINAVAGAVRDFFGLV